MEHQTISPENCAKLIQESKLTIALTGAGISTSAGIPDFRSPDGIYNSRKYDADTVFDIHHFRQDPREFFRFTRDMLDGAVDIRPTSTHTFLAWLEDQGLLEAIITQNIDPLHHRAGSKHVLSIHGSYSQSHCLACGKEYTFPQLSEMIRREEVPHCDCKSAGVIKPDVVFFGEAVKDMDKAYQLAERCDLMLVLGSSLVVYPVAMLPQITHAKVVVVNQGPVSLDAAANRYLVKQDLDTFFGEVRQAIKRLSSKPESS